MALDPDSKRGSFLCDNNVSLVVILVKSALQYLEGKKRAVF